MASPARAASPAKTRKGRTATVRPSTNIVIHGTDDDNLNWQRVQRLASLFGLTNARAKIIADLAWGGAAHG